MEHDAVTKKLHEQLGVSVYPYQQRWVDDDSRFKIVLKARQTGFSFGVALEVVLDAMERTTNWVLLSAGERQSKELMSKVRGFAQMFGALREYLEEDFRGDEGTYKQLEVVLPNGSRIIGLPANPDTARGFSGNVVLDEFGFHKDSRAIWRALFPIVSRGHKLRIVSTPNGKQNMYYDLWSDASGRWSKHRVDIYQAVEQGLPFDIDEARQAINDPDAWAQEYECQFLDSATSFLPFDLINSCEEDGATIVRPPGLDTPEWMWVNSGELFVGFDVGRKRDLSVIWTLERVADVLWTREVLRLEKTPFAQQREALYARISAPRVKRACIDSTGIGMQIAEEARDRFGAIVEEVTFTAAVKQELATTLRPRFEDRTVRIPADRAIRYDLHSVRKVVTVAGNIRYDADRSEAGGTHADHFWALALSNHAADLGKGMQPAEYHTVEQRRFAQADDGRMSMRPRPVAPPSTAPFARASGAW